MSSHPPQSGPASKANAGNATATGRSWQCLTLWTAAGAYALTALLMALAASPRVPYADPWRFLAVFLENPFPVNVLTADNGHREILPSLVRLADLQWCDANQWLQILVGIALAVAVVQLLWRGLAANQPCASKRAATLAALAVGLFWLGNSRKLAHGNEIVSLFFVLLFVAAGLRALLGGGARCAWVAGICGMLASLSFGAGAASFGAFLVVLWLRREPIRQYAIVLALAGVAALAMMIGNEESTDPRSFQLGVQIEQLLRWIGAPFVWALSPLLDAAHAERLPSALLRAVASPIANVVEGSCGTALTARWPAAAFGAIALTWLGWQTMQLRRSPQAAAARVLAIGLAWFGLGVGLLVVVARYRYFQIHPDQVVSQRYVSWSMLIWTGLLLGFVLHPERRKKTASISVLLAAIALAPSQVWTGRYAFKQQTVALQTAVAAGVEVLDRDFSFVETIPEDLLKATPLLRAASTSVWTWPEVQLLDQRLPETAQHLSARDLTTSKTDNLFAREGTTVAFACDAAATVLLLADASGTVRGLAVRSHKGTWIGWARGRHTAGDLQVRSL